MKQQTLQLGRVFMALACTFLFFSLSPNGGDLNSSFAKKSPQGAWKLIDGPGLEGGNQMVMIISGSHYAFTYFSSDPANFLSTSGGIYSIENDQVIATIEFDTTNPEMVGEVVTVDYRIKGNKMNMTVAETTSVYQRIDQGNETPLVGAWRITKRMREGEMRAMRQGPRKTIKILSGSRFQWTAFNSETAQFAGCGGGTYTLKDGTYTEHIEYFSRDNSRVGANLSFDAAVEGKDWQHSGLSSKGAPINEIWSNQDTN